MKKSQNARSSAKDVFSYLLMIIMLYVGVIFFITLLWQYINVQFPDPLEFYYSQASSLIRAAISALLVVWPVFLLISWSINRDLSTDESRERVWIRKWLLYLTLFAAAITIIIDLITLTNSFLGGELTTRFVLKVVVILVVAIAVFSFYLWELRRDVAVNTMVHKISAIAGSVILIAWIVAGFFIVGTPSQQRNIRLDDERVGNLQSLQFRVIDFWSQKESLPENIDELSNSINGYVAPIDPETGESYTYRVIGELEFELCASFVTDSEEVAGSLDYVERPGYYIGDSKGENDSWEHGVGEVCFVRVIDPELHSRPREIELF